MTRRAPITPRSHPPRHVLDRAADGDRHALDYRGKPMPSVRSLLLIRPDGFTVWDVDALRADVSEAVRLPRRRAHASRPPLAPSAAGERTATQDGQP